jgi:RND superfamily putative drug exporter
VVSMSVAAALTLLPAVLSLLGDRVNSLKLPYLGRRILDDRAAGRTSWIARMAYRAMRRPAVALVVGVGVLLLLAYPALDMKTGVSGVNSFPNDFESKQGFAVLEQQFSAGGVNPVEVVVDGDAAAPAVQTAMARLTQEMAGDPAFGPVQTQTAESGDLALLTVPVNSDAVGDLALSKVRELRSTLIPQAFDGSGASVYVTGQTAGNLDYIDIVNRYFPWVVALVLTLSFLLLLVAFRSIVIPLKAILMNLLSVGAAYGLVTLVSLKGWGADLLGFQQVPVVEQWVPLLLFAVLFGLSMDYQVFLLSRIKEAWDRTGDNTAAVTEGVGATAGIITGAALIMVAVFAGFAAGDLVMFQQMGFGLAVAVLLDATLIRTVLVPAAMKLLGRWNWYLPSWLEWLPHLSIEGTPAAPLAGPSTPTSGGPGLEPAEERAA